MGSKESENPEIRKFFDQYYDGFSHFSPTKRKSGWKLSFATYLQLEWLARSVYKLLCTVAGFTTLSNKNILDVGCGDGHALRWLVEWGAEPANCYGVDAAKAIVEEAKRLSASDINFSHSMGDELNFSDEKFDLILCFGVIIHVLENSTIESMAKEMFRVSKPGGYLFLLITNESVNYNAGWMNQRVRTFNRKEQEVEKLFSDWKPIARDDTLQEGLKALLDLVEKGLDENSAKPIRDRVSDDIFLMQGNNDLEIAKLVRNNSLGAMSLYVLQK